MMLNTPLPFYDFSLDFNENCEAMRVFQLKNNPILQFYADLLPTHTHPFLPIKCFKSHAIKTGVFNDVITFSSSGTTGEQTSKHYVKDLSYYEAAFVNGFNYFYGNHVDYCFLCLLPSYLEREGSSLVYMANYFIQNSEYKQSDFFLHDLDKLKHILLANEKAGIPTILLGVSYALLDLAAFSNFELKHTIVMETGGMKGQRKEMVRSELHAILCEAFGVTSIHSEYGMTELLSQAYSKGDGLFKCPPWMQIKIRDTYDPLSYIANGKTGGLNIIDLANKDSCAFIETQDLGKLYDDGSFEVLGRFDHSDVRGCNLLIG
jgi:hypothetical protein